MTLSKEELFAKYKKLKAQGVSVSLMDLKKEGVNDATNSYENTSSAGGVNNSGVNSVTNSYENTYSSRFEANSVPTNGEGTSSWTTSYSSLPQVNSQSDYSGNVPQNSQIQNKSYTDNFSGNFSFQIEQSPQTQEPKIPYSGNVVPKAEIQQPEEKTQRYCLIGYPLGHSLSSYIHNAGFKSLGLNSNYEILETPPDSLIDRIKFLKSNNYAGFNVTIPLKLPVTLFLDEVDVSADIVGAVNTVVINPDKTMKGYNTDVIGFRRAIPEDITLIGKVAGVLGTGGAARAAITALAQAQVKSIKIYTRNVPNSIELLTFLRARFPKVEFNSYQIEFIRDLSDIDILVNTTPIGMQGRAADLTPIEENELRTLPKGAVVYDVIYNPKKTILLKLAEKNGYRTINGVDMFIYQALVSEEIWTGRTPDFKDMKIAALENL
jgi:shikimate dehydrogenase